MKSETEEKQPFGIYLFCGFHKSYEPFRLILAEMKFLFMISGSSTLLYHLCTSCVIKSVGLKQVKTANPDLHMNQLSALIRYTFAFSYNAAGFPTLAPIDRLVRATIKARNTYFKISR